MSTRDVAQGVRTRAFSSEEAVQSSLDRIQQVNPEINALVEVDAEAALNRAREADDCVRRGDELGPLHGVPVSFKMNTNMAERATMDGVRAYAGNIATESDPQVSSWLKAGAISVGRSNCPPFSTRWTTEGDFYGATINPWDPAITPGGSSGGAASAVATGMCSLAQGNDIGGSIRYPAACCGVLGIRPTAGRVPAWAGSPSFDPPMAVQAFVVQGPLARTVDDLRLGLHAMQSRDARDPSAVPAADWPDSARRSTRVAVVTDPGGAGLAGSSTPEAVEAARVAGGWLSEGGYAVEEVELPLLGEAAALWWKLALTEFKIAMVAEVERVGDPGIRRFFQLMFQAYEGEFGEVDLAGFVAGYARRGMIRRQVSVFMQDYPLIVTPVSGEPPFPMGDDVVSMQRTAELMAHQWPSMSIPVLGLPGLGMPAIRTDGAPVGVQIVGRGFEEEAVFRAGEVIEARCGITTPIDPVYR